MKYFVKYWKPEAFPPRWQISYWSDVCGYDDLNEAYRIKEYAGGKEPSMIYIVVDDKEAQPSPP